MVKNKYQNFFVHAGGIGYVETVTGTYIRAKQTADYWARVQGSSKVYDDHGNEVYRKA